MEPKNLIPRFRGKKKSAKVTLKLVASLLGKRKDKVAHPSGRNAIIMKITKDTTLADILKLPKAEKILVKYNLPCLGCPMAKFELENLKIGEACKMYGIDLDKLLKDLNERIKNKRT